jgi:hypothetical protein
MKKEQKYVIRNEGLSKNKNNVCDNIIDDFNNSEKADIIVTIKLV